MIMSNNAPVSKGKIVIATVKGDVHDIGKNIVKVTSLRIMVMRLLILERMLNIRLL